MFIWAEPPRNNELLYVWWPAAIAEFGGCRGRRGKYLIDCYVSAVTGFSVARFLLIRKLPNNVKILNYPSFNAPVLTPVEHGMSGLLEDARKVWENLREPGRAVKTLLKEVPEVYYEPRHRRNILRFPFMEPKVRVRERIMYTNADILREIIKGLCLDKGIYPTNWEPVHVLIGLDLKKELAYLFIGKSPQLSKALSMYIFRTSLKDKLLSELPAWRIR